MYWKLDLKIWMRCGEGAVASVYAEEMSIIKGIRSLKYEKKNNNQDFVYLNVKRNMLYIVLS